ncbi:MAG TPA: O-antigen ligase family protein, partial [Candidatus Angelobacter sp.]|nr:O-antigen ligase family protein [Candidatus Angelobacter sp.]
PGAGFLMAIVLAMICGGLQGGTNLFFDWRALALGIGVYGVFAMWLQTADQVQWAVELFAGFMAVRLALIYAEFLRGGGDAILGVRIPVYDGPTQSALVFTAVLAVCLGDYAGGWPRALWNGLAGASYLLVMLCFRRTFWAVLGVATLLAFLLQRRRRGQKLLLAAAAFAAVTVLLGPTFYQRIQSMDFTQGETEFSQSNPDHVGEVLDAWEQVEKNPLLGIGLGRSFQTLRIPGWKEESVMVHNAPLHVWLKYGLLGLGCYLWFHAALLWWLYRQRGKFKNQSELPFPRFGGARFPAPSAAMAYREYAESHDLALVSAVLVYLAAQFVVSLGFTPWPYSSVQSTILIAFRLALAIRGANLWNYQLSPSSLRR